MRHTSAEWTDSKGIPHRCEFYQRTASEERHDHLTVGAIVVVDPVNKQKKHICRNQVFVIKRIRYWHSIAKAVLVPLHTSSLSLSEKPNEWLDVAQKAPAEQGTTADICDLRRASDQEISDQEISVSLSKS